MQTHVQLSELLPGLYAAWEFGITEFSLSWILVIMQMLRIFLIVERRMIGRKFPGGLAGFPGFGMGISIPCWISVGISPVAAIRLKMLAISPWSSLGPYFSSSALMLSTPRAFVVCQTFCSNFFSRERIIHFGWFNIFHFVDVFFVECFFKELLWFQAVLCYP